METNIMPLLKQVFKEQKHFFFWDNLNLDDLNDECMLKNSITVLKNGKIVYYHKFTFLSEEVVESELIYSKSPIYTTFAPVLFKNLVEQGFEIYASIFENNKQSYNSIKAIGFQDYTKMFSFCMENPFYEPQQPSQPLNNRIEINNGILGFNGCYLFYEASSILNDYVITTIIEIAKKLNIKYIIFFTELPHLLMNELPYKITNIVKLDTVTPQIEKIATSFNIKNVIIINNLEFPNSFERT